MTADTIFWEGTKIILVLTFIAMIYESLTYKEPSPEEVQKSKLKHQEFHAIETLGLYPCVQRIREHTGRSRRGCVNYYRHYYRVAIPARNINGKLLSNLWFDYPFMDNWGDDELQAARKALLVCREYYNLESGKFIK